MDFNDTDEKLFLNNFIKQVYIDLAANRLVENKAMEIWKIGLADYLYFTAMRPEGERQLIEYIGKQIRRGNG